MFLNRMHGEYQTRRAVTGKIYRLAKKGEMAAIHFRMSGEVSVGEKSSDLAMHFIKMTFSPRCEERK